MKQPTLAEKISRGFNQKINLDADIGDLLKQAKTACDAGREPDASIASAINAKRKQSLALALDVGQMLTHADPQLARRALGRAYDATIVASFIEYARNPTSDNYDKTIETMLAVVTGQGRFGTGIGRRK